MDNSYANNKIHREIYKRLIYLLPMKLGFLYILLKLFALIANFIFGISHSQLIFQTSFYSCCSLFVIISFIDFCLFQLSCKQIQYFGITNFLYQITTKIMNYDIDHVIYLILGLFFQILNFHYVYFYLIKLKQSESFSAYTMGADIKEGYNILESFGFAVVIMMSICVYSDTLYFKNFQVKIFFYFIKNLEYKIFNIKIKYFPKIQ